MTRSSKAPSGQRGPARRPSAGRTDQAPLPATLLTTVEVAEVLRVHPKHVYRLLKKGLPARRVGAEWRFDRERRAGLVWRKRPQPEARAPASYASGSSATRSGGRERRRGAHEPAPS